MQATMKGAALLRDGDHYCLEVQDMPVPPVGEGEVLVKVYASAVSHMCESFLHGLSNERVESLRASLGQDVLTGIEFSGVVETDGTRFHKGDEVIGYIAVLRDRRSQAEYTAVAETALALKPAGLSHAEAASMPANALTAFQALTVVTQVKPGDRVLVIGASGSVGIHAVQLARHLGAHVVGVCNPAVMDKVKVLGAHEVFDYTRDISELEGGFNLVFDTAPSQTFAACDALLVPGGTYITTLPSRDPEGAELAKAAGKNWGYLMVLEVPGDGLDKTAELIGQGGFAPVIDSVYALAEVASAHARFSEKGKVGKVVVTITD